MKLWTFLCFSLTTSTLAYGQLSPGTYQLNGTIETDIRVRAYLLFKVADERETTDVKVSGILTADENGATRLDLCSTQIDVEKIKLDFRQDQLPLASNDIDLEQPFELVIQDQWADATVFVKGTHQVDITGKFTLAMEWPTLEEGVEFEPLSLNLTAEPAISGIQAPLRAVADIEDHQDGSHFFRLEQTDQTSCL